MFYVIDKTTGEPVCANGFWAVDEDGKLFDIMDGWGCEGGGGSSAAPDNFIAVFGRQPVKAIPIAEQLRPFKCDVCDKRFGSNEAFRNHRVAKEHF